MHSKATFYLMKRRVLKEHSSFKKTQQMREREEENDEYEEGKKHQEEQGQDNTVDDRHVLSSGVPILMLLSGGYTKPLSAQTIGQSILNLHEKGLLMTNTQRVEEQNAQET